MFPVKSSMFSCLDRNARACQKLGGGPGVAGQIPDPLAAQEFVPGTN